MTALGSVPEPPALDRSRRRIWAVAAAVALALGCLGGIRAMREPAPTAKRLAAPA